MPITCTLHLNYNTYVQLHLVDIRIITHMYQP